MIHLNSIYEIFEAILPRSAEIVIRMHPWPAAYQHHDGSNPVRSASQSRCRGILPLRPGALFRGIPEQNRTGDGPGRGFSAKPARVF